MEEGGSRDEEGMEGDEGMREGGSERGMGGSEGRRDVEREGGWEPERSQVTS